MSRKLKTMLGMAVGAAISIPLWFLLAVPELEKMPADYQRQWEFVGEARLLDPGDGVLGDPFPFKDTSNRKVLLPKEEVVIIQINMVARNLSTGEILWETHERMAVDRYTRMHVSGLGNADRQGHFTFPLHLEKRNYEFWYPGLLDSLLVIFEREETLKGLNLYVFTFSIKEIPSSDLYPQYKPRLLAGDKWGTFWVEPVSGYVVGYDLSSEVYFVEDGQKGLNVEVRHKSFTKETHENQIRAARDKKLLIRLYEVWIPLFLVISALVLFAAVAKVKHSPKTKENRG